MMETKPLIYNEDLVVLEKKMATQNLTSVEMQLLRHKGWNEHKVQSAAKRFFDSMNQELEMQNIGQVFFFQIDNGANNLTAGAKIRKWQEGTVPKMTDVCILAHSIKTQQNKTWFCEFKKVGTKNEIEGNPKTKSGLKIYIHFQKQLIMQEKLRKMNFSVHLTNNIIYCERVIGKEIREFLA